MVTIICIIFVIYVCIGIYLYVEQEKWAKKNDPEFFEELTDNQYLFYVLHTVFLWLPMLIEFYTKNNHDDYNNF